jgi:acyl-CoA thioesterase I
VEGVSSAEYFAPLLSKLRVEWPKNETVHLVAHGHSVPAGYFRTPMVQPFDSYPHLVHAGLKGGENSISGAERFDRDVLALRPKLVMIDYGLNDRGPGLVAARDAWSGMIRKCQAAGILVVLLTPTSDSRINMLDDNGPLAQHAAQIRKLASEFQVALADSFRIYQEHMRAGGKVTDLLSQVNHPNRRGHELVAAEVLRQIAG